MLLVECGVRRLKLPNVGRRHLQSGCTSSSTSSARSVIAYSTLLGTSANTSLVTSPSRSSYYTENDQRYGLTPTEPDSDRPIGNLPTTDLA
jgi:hypothetical protein